MGRVKAEKKRGPRCPRELVKRMGQWLMEAGPNFPRQVVAQQLGVSERTLRNWKRGAKGVLKPLGRPAVSASQRFQARLKVARALKGQGFQSGWRPVLAKVKPLVSTRLVQESVRELKKRHRRKHSKELLANRIHVEVLAPDVIWAQDSTHAGRENKKAIQAEVIKDRATLGYVGLAVGPPATAEGISQMLEARKRCGGCR